MVREVAEREIRTRSRTKAFRVITAILVAAAIIGPIISALWPDGGDDLRRVTVGLVDAGETTQQQILTLADGNLDLTFQDYTGASPAEVDRALSDGDIDVALDTGPTVVESGDGLRDRRRHLHGAAAARDPGERSGAGLGRRRNRPIAHAAAG